MGDSISEKLSGIYYNFGSAGAFSGPQALLKGFRIKYPKERITSREVSDFLALQTAHSLHRKSFKNYKCNSLFFPRVNYQFVADLIDMVAYSKYNCGYKYILCVMDGLSRYLYTRKLKTKKSNVVLNAFREIFKESEVVPNVLTTDKGNEFVAKQSLNYFKSKGIHYFTSYGRKKCSNIERLNRTIKNMIYRCFDKNLNREWVSILKDLTATYNLNYHRGIAMSPLEAQDPINAVLLSERHGERLRAVKLEAPRLKMGDIVRINIDRGALSKKYEMSWSRALYRVASKPQYTIAGSRPSYNVEYLNGMKIAGSFLPEELLKVDKSVFLDNYKFPIYKVVKRRGSKSLVRWLGYDKHDDTWEPTKNIKNITAKLIPQNDIKTLPPNT